MYFLNMHTMLFCMNNIELNVLNRVVAVNKKSLEYFNCFLNSKQIHSRM